MRLCLAGSRRKLNFLTPDDPFDFPELISQFLAQIRRGLMFKASVMQTYHEVSQGDEAVGPGLTPVSEAETEITETNTHLKQAFCDTWLVKPAEATEISTSSGRQIMV